MARIVRIWGFAPLLAGLLLGGCVNDVTVPPEGRNLLWKTVKYPDRQRVNCIAIDPDGRIFLGVYDYEFEEYDMGAIYLSSDNGETWAKKQLGIFEIVNLAIDSEGRVFAEGYDRIARSLDHGESWETLGFRSNTALKLVVDSSDNLYLRTISDGIYFSDDHGDSWTQIGDSIRAAGELMSLAVNSKGCLFAIAGQRLYRSCDRGASWAELQDIPWDRNPGLQVAIDSGDRIFISNYISLYRSTDDGETWTEQERPFQHESINEISIDRKDRLYLRCNFSLSVSEDSGDSWISVLSLRYNFLECIASNAAGDIFAAGRWGVSRSIDAGEHWEMLGFSEFLPVAIAVDGNGVFYMGLESGGVYRSIDHLATWERFDAGLSDIRLNCLVSANESILIAGTANGIYASPKDRPDWSLYGLPGFNAWKVFALSGDSVAAFTTNSLVISHDGGSTWSDIGLYGYDVRALIRTGDGSLFAGANFGGVFRYTGEGVLWDQMNEGLGDVRVNALAVTRGGDILAGTDTGIFISSNGGASWRRFSAERTLTTTVLVVDEDVFFGTHKGILWTRTGGSALSQQNDGLSSLDLSTIYSIAADPDDYLFLLTSRNIFRSSQSTKELSPSGL